MLGFVTGVLAISAHVIVSQPNGQSPVVVARETYGHGDVIFRRLRSHEIEIASARAKEEASDNGERSGHEIPPNFYTRLASSSTAYAGNLSHEAQIAAQALIKDADNIKKALELLNMYADFKGKPDATEEETKHVDQLLAAAFKEWSESGLNIEQVKVLFITNKNRTPKYERLINEIAKAYSES